MADPQVAVLIDFENVGLNSVQWLFDQISDVGRIIVKRAYADWAASSKGRDQLLELGIEPIHLFHSAGSGKNSSDIRLVIDAIDLLHSSPVDTFVVVSADSDFVPLVSRLRSAGKTVIGAGRQAVVSRSLVLSCDRYLYLDHSEERLAIDTSTDSVLADNLLVRGVEAAMDDQGKVVGSKLHQTLQRLDPSFDFRSLGHSTFTKYLEAAPEVRITRPNGPGDVVVELAGNQTAAEPSDSRGWDSELDAVWAMRASKSGQPIPGPSAAADAARVLGATTLSSTRYKTLQKLLDASNHLRTGWRRDGNKIIRL